MKTVQSICDAFEGSKAGLEILVRLLISPFSIVHTLPILFAEGRGFRTESEYKGGSSDNGVILEISVAL
jgi:hypothetical protein